MPQKYDPTTQGDICSTDNCDQRAVQYCTEGCHSGHLCTHCINQQCKFKLTKGHVVIDMDESDEDKINSLYCETHPTIRVDQLCKDCDLAACDTCLLQHHKQHHLVDLKDEAELEHILKQTDVIVELISEHIADTDKQDKQSKADIDNMKQVIHQVIDGIIDKWNQKRHKLITSLHQIEGQKKKVVMAARDGQNFTKTAMTSLRSYTESVLKHGRDWDRIQQVKEIKTRLMAITKASIPSFVWSHSENRKEASLNDMTVADIALTADVVGSDSKSKPSKDFNVTKTEHEVQKIHLEDKTRYVKGMAVIRQTLWVVHFDSHPDQQQYLYAYSTKPPYHHQKVHIKQSDMITDMVRFPLSSTQLVVSVCPKTLLWIKLEQHYGKWHVSSLKSVNVGYCTLALAVHDNQLLVHGQDNEVHIFSGSREEIGRINMPITLWPWKILQQRGSTDQTLTRFGRGQSSCHGQYIYVTNSKENCVNVLDREGHHVSQIFSLHDVMKTHRLCIDEEGLMYVAQGKREVWVIDTKDPTRERVTEPPGERQLDEKPIAPGPLGETAGKLTVQLADTLLKEQINVMKLSVTWWDYK